jgi:hypothetical protein
VSELSLSEAYMKPSSKGGHVFIAIPCRDKNANCVLVESDCRTASRRNRSEFVLYEIPREQTEAAIRELK